MFSSSLCKHCKMSKKCITRRCVLQNLAYNLAVNTVISGLGSVIKSTFQPLIAGFVLMGVGVLLLVGTYKENRSLILTVLILEPFLLAYESVRLGVDFMEYKEGIKKHFGIFNFLGIFGVIFCWFLIFPVYVLYKDLDRKESKNETKQSKENLNLKVIKSDIKQSKDNLDNNETSKNALA